ncbi:MAG: CcmD family protein [Ferruginibacter sp.]|nr:CcmD family protein [Ferruginibacter sp.]
MRNSVYCLLLLVCGFCSSAGLYAQGNEAVEGTMRSNGKIYVVLAICITILAGLFVYLVSIDRKIAKIEDKQ